MHIRDVAGRRQEQTASAGILETAYDRLDVATVSFAVCKLAFNFLDAVGPSRMGIDLIGKSEDRLVVAEDLFVRLSDDLFGREVEDIGKRPVAQQITVIVVDILHREHNGNGVDGGVP